MILFFLIAGIWLQFDAGVLRDSTPVDCAADYAQLFFTTQYICYSNKLDDLLRWLSDGTHFLEGTPQQILSLVIHSPLTGVRMDLLALSALSCSIGLFVRDGNDYAYEDCTSQLVAATNLLHEEVDLLHQTLEPYTPAYFATSEDGASPQQNHRTEVVNFKTEPVHKNISADVEIRIKRHSFVSYLSWSAGLILDFVMFCFMAITCVLVWCVVNVFGEDAWKMWIYRDILRVEPDFPVEYIRPLHENSHVLVVSRAPRTQKSA